MGTLKSFCLQGNNVCVCILSLTKEVSHHFTVRLTLHLLRPQHSQATLAVDPKGR